MSIVVSAVDDDSGRNNDTIDINASSGTTMASSRLPVLLNVETENSCYQHTNNHHSSELSSMSPSIPDAKQDHSKKDDDRISTTGMYQYLVLDSGPIIKRFYSSNTGSTTTSITRIWEKAQYIYTVPAVISEIRDANARQYLQSLPFEIILQEPKSTSVQHIIQFAKLTGDYHSLSHTDIQVLALVYDLEIIGCRGNISHIRTTPKRKLGLGKIQSLGDNNQTDSHNTNQPNEVSVVTTSIDNDAGAATGITEDATTKPTMIDEKDYTVEVDDYDDEIDGEEGVNDGDGPPGDEGDWNQNNDIVANNGQPTDDVLSLLSSSIVPQPKSWVSLLRPAVSIATSTIENENATTTTEGKTNTHGPQPVLQSRVFTTQNNSIDSNFNDTFDIGGQFSDASEDGNDDDSDWSDDDIDDNKNTGTHTDIALEQELRSDFPSLAASILVPCDDEIEGDNTVEGLANTDTATVEATASEERKFKSLQPISKSGKLYNSFTKYKDLMKPKPTLSMKSTPILQQDQPPLSSTTISTNDDDPDGTNNNFSSRIIGSSGNNGQMEDDFEDDGEGWITNTKDITKMKAAGALDPTRTPNDLNNTSTNNNGDNGPMISHRAACVTTDFAMQNVILQMNLELLSLDGIRVRKLKNWVTRCGACYTVYTNTDTNNVVGPLGKRLFCEKCGSDVMQRIAASVDGKTGRLRLHLSKKYQYNLRGTKFSLPKPGTNNRFQGDLLLREDQLLMGAWSQKLKMISGGKTRDAAQSIFGRDIATNVGCHANSVNMDDIRVGFGRRNPNAVKGRERRGKKKKSVNTACGLRRY